MHHYAWSKEVTPVACRAPAPDNNSTCAKEAGHTAWCSDGNLEWLDNAWNVSSYDDTQQAPPMDTPAEPPPAEPAALAVAEPVKPVKLSTLTKVAVALFFAGGVVGHIIGGKQSTATTPPPPPVTSTVTVPAKEPPPVTTTAVRTTTATVTRTTIVLRP